MRKIGLLILFFAGNALSNSSPVESSEDKKFRPVAIPTISADRSKGTGLGVIGMGFFKLGEDEDTPESRVGFFANATTRDNYNALLFQQLFLNDDAWRLASAQILANSNFQTFQSSPALGGTVEIPYNNYVKLFFLTLQKRIFTDFYFGPSISIGSADTTIDLDDEDEEFTQTLNALGLAFTYDTTDNIYNATSGLLVRLRWNDYAEDFGNDIPFGSVNLKANHYHDIDEGKVLASRLSWYKAYGDVPFVGERFVGNIDIRGYTQGEYRGDEIYAAQTEYRWNFYEKWGAVFFGGIAQVKEDEGWSDLLPGGGTGLRYRLLDDRPINAGFDYAVGNADWGVYFRITEAY